MGKEPRTPVPPSVCTEHVQVTPLFGSSHAPFDVILMIAPSTREAGSRFIAQAVLARVTRTWNSSKNFGSTTRIPFLPVTTVPKDDPRWAKMYCVLMFDGQIFSEHRYEGYIRNPTPGRYSR